MTLRLFVQNHRQSHRQSVRQGNTQTNSKTNHWDKQTSKSSGQLQTHKHTDTHTVTDAYYFFFFLNIRIGERGIHVMCLSAFNKNSFHHLVKHRGASRGSMGRCIEHRSQVPRGPGCEAALALQWRPWLPCHCLGLTADFRLIFQYSLNKRY